MKSIDREAIISSLMGEASVEEIQRLIRWREASAENEATYQRIARTWTASGELGPAPMAEPAPDAASIVRAAAAHAHVRPAARRRSAPERIGSALSRLLTPLFGWRPAWAAAALAVLLGFLLLSRLAPTDPGLRAETFVTGVDETATVVLDDQTVVRLASSSRMTIGGLREVSLQGRAFFAVRSDGGRPFRVSLSTGDVVEVLGTRFDVMSGEEGLQVAVAEGTVRLGSSGRSIDVSTNQVARAESGQAPEVDQVPNVYQVIDWLGAFLAFESTPMRDVAEELRVRFGLQIEIVDAELADRTVTGWFADQTPEEIMGGICRAVAASCSVENGVHRMVVARM